MPNYKPNFNDVLLRRRMSICVSKLPMDHPAIFPEKMSVVHEMMKLGFIPAQQLFDKIETKEQLYTIRNEILPAMNHMVDGDISYNPMYRNFPQEVMDKDLAELYFNAIVHYWSFGTLYPDSTAIKRDGLPEADKTYKAVTSVEPDYINRMFTSLIHSSTPYSPQDKEDIKTLSESLDILQHMPKQMDNKENIASIALIIAENKQNKAEAIRAISPYISNVNDVLRIMNTLYGNGDATLSEKISIGKMPRPDRRACLALINKCNNIAQDMKTNIGAWIRVGEILHPGEYKDKYSRAFYAFDAMRERPLTKQVKTFNAKAEEAIAKGGVALDELAKTNPGMIARNLDRLLRQNSDTTHVLKVWTKAAPRVSPNLLWTVYSHLKERPESEYRTFITKGQKPQSKTVKNNLPFIPHPVLKQAENITVKALYQIYKNKSPMGRVYIDPTIAQCKVPSETRTASGGRSLAKGSRLPMDASKNTMRSFVWWTNYKNAHDSHDRVDIDLSAIMLDSKYKMVDYISYYRLKGTIGVGVHSGDITNGGPFDEEGVAEFIDIDLKKAKKQGIRYVITSVNAFTRQPFSELEHLHTGYMMRENAKSGEIFEPATVQEKIKLSAPSTAELVCAFDLEKNQMIWLDSTAMNVRDISRIQNVHGTFNTTFGNFYHLLHIEKPDIADVIAVNTLARGGQLVSTPEEADVVFALTNDDKYGDKPVITPYELETFAGDLMPAQSTLADDFYLGKNPEQGKITPWDASAISNVVTILKDVTDAPKHEAIHINMDEFVDTDDR